MKKKYRKTKVDFDNDLPLNKTLEIRSVTTVVRDVFHKNNKYYPPGFLNECLYET